MLHDRHRKLIPHKVPHVLFHCFRKAYIWPRLFLCKARRALIASDWPNPSPLASTGITLSNPWHSFLRWICYFHYLWQKHPAPQDWSSLRRRLPAWLGLGELPSQPNIFFLPTSLLSLLYLGAVAYSRMIQWASFAQSFAYLPLLVPTLPWLEN